MNLLLIFCLVVTLAIHLFEKNKSGPENSTTTGDPIICDDELKTLHGSLSAFNNTNDIHCCENAMTKHKTTCGNGTDCATVCGVIPTCAKVVTDPEEGKDHCSNSKTNTRDGRANNNHQMVIMKASAMIGPENSGSASATNGPNYLETTTGCCNKLDVHISDPYAYFTGTYTKQTNIWNNKTWYQIDSHGYYCIWYRDWWKITPCSWMSNSAGLGLVFTWMPNIMCPGDVWLNWKHVNYDQDIHGGCDHCGPVDPTMVIDCKSSSSLTQEVELSVSGGYFPKTFTDETEIATLISNITNEESSDRRGRFTCCKGTGSNGECTSATIGPSSEIETIKAYQSHNDTTTTNGDTVLDLCKNQTVPFTNTTLAIVYEPSAGGIPEPIPVQCALCNILLTSCCPVGTSVPTRRCRAYFGFYCNWLNCCKCDLTPCLNTICTDKEQQGCYQK